MEPPAGLIPMTCNELQRLLTRLVLEPARRPADPEAWSRWRRRHQYRARVSGSLPWSVWKMTPLIAFFPPRTAPAMASAA